MSLGREAAPQQPSMGAGTHGLASGLVPGYIKHRVVLALPVSPDVAVAQSSTSILPPKWDRRLLGAEKGK